MKTALRILAFTSAVLIAGPAAHAAGPGGDARAACKDDAQTFCKSIQPGGGRIKDCLEDHYKELSDACYTALQNLPSPPQGGHTDPGPPPEGNEPPPDDRQ